MVGIESVTQRSKDWIEENIATAGWQWLGNIFWAEPKPMIDLIKVMVDEGLTEGSDFIVWHD